MPYLLQSEMNIRGQDSLPPYIHRLFISDVRK